MIYDVTHTQLTLNAQERNIYLSLSVKLLFSSQTCQKKNNGICISGVYIDV